MAASKNVFVSKPNALNGNQRAFWDKLAHVLDQRSLIPRTLGETDYPNAAPIEAVRRLLSECEGALVLGLAQLDVGQGVRKAGSDAEADASGSRWPTAWNHIEAAMAYVMEKPLLIVHEPGVEGGIFDVGNTDRYIHKAELTVEWLDSPRFLQPLNEWFLELHAT
ncbi:hypothetical protein [Paraconexibacter algicola]|uniref:Nucleoside 2-deoxyribosyltransferase n=1 Tax=Paraconexibacter algicola TaxID=2133960 RepID=A0A2T4ULI3_9ACTN|nr:hypothetical protein [Paraconexibacter algicola]PTL60058.1 hypothetical protein C7Y72_10580 [Paraconexibacter algicola]